MKGELLLSVQSGLRFEDADEMSCMGDLQCDKKGQTYSAFVKHTSTHSVDE